MSSFEVILIIVASTLTGLLFFGVFLHRKKLSLTLEKAQQESKKFLENARREADRLVKSAIKDAKEESRRRRRVFEEEAKKRKNDVNTLELKIRQREQSIDNRREISFASHCRV